MTLRKKLIIAFLAVTLLPFSALIIGLSLPAVNQAETLIGSQLQDNVAFAADSIDQFMINCIREMKAFSADPDYLHEDPEANIAYLSRLTYFYPYFDQFFFTSLDGTVITSSDRTNIGKSLFTLQSNIRDDFEAAAHGLPGFIYVSDFGNTPHPETSDHKALSPNPHLQLELLAPVFDKEGKCIGILIAAVVTQHLRDLLEDIDRRIPGDEFSFLSDSHGHVIMSANPDLLLEHHPDEQRLNTSIEKIGSSKGNFIYLDSKNEKVLGGYADLWPYGANKAGNWRLIATAPYGAIMKPVKETFNQVILILAVALLLSTAIGLYIAHALANPILKLTAGAKTIAAGDFATRVSIPNKDETGALASSFNQMAETIQEQVVALRAANEELETRVQERTSEIAEKNETLKKEITTRIRSEQERDRFFQLSPDLLSIAGFDGYFKRVNPAFEKVLGYSREKLLSRPFIELVIDEDKPATAEEVRKLMKGIPTVDFENRCLCSDGSIRHIAWMVTPVVEDQRLYVYGRDVTERKHAADELAEVHTQLLDASRQAGMAEVATNVLHNVGNVLNSVNVSSNIISDRIQNSKLANLNRAVALIKQHENNLAAFFAGEKGKQLSIYMDQILENLTYEHKEVLQELGLLVGKILHINEIVSVQQNYAKSPGLKEMVSISALVEDAVRITINNLDRSGIKLICEFSATPPVWLERHKTMQILVNLIRNAEHACNESGKSHKEITITITNEENTASISVADNGIGIPPENMIRIFNHGFTTKTSGHGFGLHGSALAAKEMGGSLTAHSDGTGKGARFILQLPTDQQTTL